MYNPNLQFHFVGIGGTGMSGLAEILLNLGFKVSGSDIRLNSACLRLDKLGASIFEGHRRENLPAEASLLVYSSAVTPDNPELLCAREREIPVVRRAEVLAELMRLKFGVGVAGSHGKTTTTSMVAAIMERGGLDPTVVIGGLVKAMGETGARLGRSEYLVAETDESDRSFLLLKPTLAVVTNIDTEHLEAYSSVSDLEQSFAQFVNSVPFYGLAVLCIDDPRVRLLAEQYGRRKLTYGFSPDADLSARILSQDHGHIQYEVMRGNELLMQVDLPMPGLHMASNSLAAIAVGLEFSIAPEAIREALENFKGVGRRLEVVGEKRGITVMNDYGHHPTEIRATIAAIKAGWKSTLNRLHVIFQPHRYTRTKNCFADFLEAFSHADNLVITEIYAASEPPIEGITGELLCEAIIHPSKQFVAVPQEAIHGLLKDLKSGDIVLCLGAGSIGALPEKILEAL